MSRVQIPSLAPFSFLRQVGPRRHHQSHASRLAYNHDDADLTIAARGMGRGISAGSRRVLMVEVLTLIGQLCSDKSFVARSQL